MTVHKLIAAPVGLQPGGYVKVAYEGRDKAPMTPSASLDLKRSGKGYRIGLQWQCPNPVKTTGSNTDAWVDAAAILAPAGRGGQLDNHGKRGPTGRRRAVASGPRGASCNCCRGPGKRPPSAGTGGMAGHVELGQRRVERHLRAPTRGPRSRRTSRSRWPCGEATSKTAVGSSRSAKAGSSYDRSARGCACWRLVPRVELGRERGPPARSVGGARASRKLRGLSARSIGMYFRLGRKGRASRCCCTTRSGAPDNRCVKTGCG